MSQLVRNISTANNFGFFSFSQSLAAHKFTKVERNRRIPAPMTARSGRRLRPIVRDLGHGGQEIARPERLHDRPVIGDGLAPLSVETGYSEYPVVKITGMMRATIRWISSACRSGIGRAKPFKTGDLTAGLIANLLASPPHATGMPEQTRLAGGR
jgi:hypothetical protein